MQLQNISQSWRLIQSSFIEEKSLKAKKILDKNSSMKINLTKTNKKEVLCLHLIIEK